MNSPCRHAAAQDGYFIVGVERAPSRLWMPPTRRTAGHWRRTAGHWRRTETQLHKKGLRPVLSEETMHYLMF